MSCGSTTSNSTYTIDPPSPSFADLRWWKIPLAWLAGIALAWERRCQYKQLLELDDRLLADIGISKTTVEEVRRSPLYISRGATADVRVGCIAVCSRCKLAEGKLDFA